MDTIALLKSSHAMALPAPEGGAIPEWLHIVPAGSFQGRDGRGPYACLPSEVVTNTARHNGLLDIPIDYDHQLEYSAVNGQPAPAAGWLTVLEARENGVWGRVEWTEKAREHIASREYRYVSPVFYHDESGKVLFVESVALTNIPNLTGLKALSSRESGLQPEKDSPMPFVKTLASVFGITNAEATEAAVEAAARATAAELAVAKAALSALGKAFNAPGGASGPAPDELLKAAQSVIDRAEHPDAGKWVPAESFRAVSAELDALKAAQATALVDAAKAEGKISPALEAWAKELAGRDPKALQSFLSAAPDLRPGGGKETQAKGAPPADKEKTGKLDASAKAICKNLGLSEEEYLKSAMHVQTLKGENNDGSEQ